MNSNTSYNSYSNNNILKENKNFKLTDENKLELVKSNRVLKILAIGDCQVGKTCLALKYLYNNKSNFGNFESISPNKIASNDKHNTSSDATNESSTKYSCVHANLDTYKLNSTGAVGDYIPTGLSVYKCDIKINSIDYIISLADISGCRHNEKFFQLRKDYYTRTKWYPEIRQYYRDVPILLVGTKSDIKHQIKYERKVQSSSKLSPSLEDTTLCSTTLTSGDSYKTKNVTKSSYDFSTTLSSPLSKQNSCNSKTIKCNYCSSLDMRRRSRSNLTPVESRARTRSVSIVSRVSQQHIFNANEILCDENNNELKKNKQTSTNRQVQKSPTKPSLNNESKIFDNKIDKISSDNLSKINYIESFQNKEENDENKKENPQQELDDDDYEEVCSNCNCDQCDGDDCCCCYYPDELKSNEESHVKDPNLSGVKKCDLNESSDLDDRPYLTVAGQAYNQTSDATTILNNSFSKDYQKLDSKLIQLSNEICNQFNLNESQTTKLEEIVDNPSKQVSKEEQQTDDKNVQQNQQKSTIDINMVCKTQLIRRRECLKLKQSINAKKYIQCSCLDEISVRNVLETAIKLALEYHLQRLKQEERSTKTLNTSSIRNDNSILDSSNATSTNTTDLNNSFKQPKREFSFFKTKRNKINYEKIHLNGGHLISKSCDEESDMEILTRTKYNFERKSLIDKNNLNNKKNIEENDNNLKSNNLFEEKNIRTTNAEGEKILNEKVEKLKKYESENTTRKHNSTNKLDRNQIEENLKYTKISRHRSIRCLSCTRSETSTSLNKV